MKRILTLLLVLALLPGIRLPAAAAEEDDKLAQVLALAENAVRNWEPELDLRGLLVTTNITDAVLELLEDDPELFYYKSATTWFYDFGLVDRLEFHYREGFAPADTETFEAAVKQALRCVIPGMDQLQMALVLHDYLDVHTAYDYENYQNDTIPEASYTAYGALVLGTAVCQGYSQAYRVLLDRCRIPNAYVSSDGMDHGWTLVKLEGSWYHVDVTWDDPTPDTPGRAKHKYFLLSDDAISDEEHRHYGWEADDACTDDRFDTGEFWTELSSPLPFTDADTYWMLREVGDFTDQSVSLVRCSWSSGDEKTVKTVWDYWPVWDKRGYHWADAYAGLVLWDERLFFNDKLNVYAYDPAEGSFETVFTYTGGDGYLYGLTGDGENLGLVVKRDPNEEGTLHSLSLERKYGTEPPADAPDSRDEATGGGNSGVTQGTDSTAAFPLSSWTRGQVLGFLWRAIGCPAPESSDNLFIDVPEKADYRDAVLWAVEQGIAAGTGRDPETGFARFSPDAECSWTQLFTFLWRTLTSSGASA